MIQTSDKSLCSGCGACADICPKNCIEYIEDRKGFLYPSVDTGTCVNCGLCEKVCPLLPANAAVSEPSECLAAWAKNAEIHGTSASGGIGQLLAIRIIEEGGVVYGCSAEQPWHVRHVRVEDANKLALLRGSKYVQSDTRGIYSQIKKDINEGRAVLFVGTPCQVSAVRNLFRKTPENLYIVDLICHGVPSQKMLNEQFCSIVGRNGLKSITDLSFRNSTDYIFRFNYSDPKIKNHLRYAAPMWKVPYYKEFFECRSFRPSCYSCPYAGSKRTGDLTIGDFWGIKEPEKLDESSSRGVSVILVNNDRGARLVASISSGIHKEKRPLSEAVEGNTQLRHASPVTRRGRAFQALYPIVSLKAASFIANADRKFKSLLRLLARKSGIIN